MTEIFTFSGVQDALNIKFPTNDFSVSVNESKGKYILEIKNGGKESKIKMSKKELKLLTLRASTLMSFYEGLLQDCLEKL